MRPWDCGLLLVCILLSCQSLPQSEERTAAWNFYAHPTGGGRLAHSLCGSLDERLVAFGGIDEATGSLFNSSLVIFDSRRHSWQIVEDPKGPAPRNFASFAVYDQSVFIFGGETSQSQATSDAFVYDLRQRQWASLPPAPDLVPRKQATLSAVGKQLVLFGGRGVDPVSNWARYDPGKSRWHVHPSPAVMRSRISHVALALGDRELLVWGGFVGQERQGDGFVLDVLSRNLRVIPSTPLLTARANARAVLIDDVVYIWGGQTQDGNANSGASLHLKSGLWQSLPSIPDDRFQDLKGGEIAPWNGRGFLLFGGRFGTDTFHDQVWLFEVESRQWTRIQLDETPQGRLAHCFVPLTPTRLAVFGGIGYEKGTSSLAQFSGVWMLDLPGKSSSTTLHFE